MNDDICWSQSLIGAECCCLTFISIQQHVVGVTLSKCYIWGTELPYCYKCNTTDVSIKLVDNGGSWHVCPFFLPLCIFVNFFLQRAANGTIRFFGNFIFCNFYI